MIYLFFKKHNSLFLVGLLLVSFSTHAIRGPEPTGPLKNKNYKMLEPILRYIEENAEEGVYRKSGSHSTTVAYSTELGELLFDLTKKENVDLFALAVAVKTYVRDLRIINEGDFTGFFLAGKTDIGITEGREKFVQYMRNNLLQRIHPPKRAIFVLVFDHLYRLLDKADKTKMGASNLGIVFGPNFFPPERMEGISLSDPMRMLEIQGGYNTFVEKAILTYPQWSVAE